jgi:hypothetical protein
MVKSDEFFAGAGVLTVGLLGDYNADSVVDAADYVVWRKTDGSSDGYDVWLQNFGNVAAGSGSISHAASGAVPEPSSIFLLVLGAATLAGGRSWR